ncbi:hypothetical protein VF21_01140 [Pseudogymnoascus sp. 05NY08]|nr:hypothetical protein VF21_01140 [Pseudogymnoascus sp. 05NY08]
MVTLRDRPSREIEDIFIPTERRSSLRSQDYSSPTSTARHFSSALYIGSDQSPSRKRGKVLYADSDGSESESEIHPSPTKRPRANKAKTNKARLSYPSPPSKDESVKTPSVKSDIMSGIVLLDLPLEIHQNIIQFLPSDEDVNHYGAACKALRACVGPIVWQMRFLRTFDGIPDAGPVKLQAQYKKRRGIATRYVSFDNGTMSNQKACLDMLKEMIVESNGHIVRDEYGNESVSGLNHRFFSKYFQDTPSTVRRKGSDLLDNLGRIGYDLTPKKRPSRQESLTKVVKLLFTHLLLHPHSCNIKTDVFLASQEFVYKCFKEAPLFLGRNKNEINIMWLLHAANFFKFHFKMPDGEGILAHMYQQLEKGEWPMPWAGKLKSGTQKLGPYWKGAFTFLQEEDIRNFRTGDHIEAIVDETTDGNNGFQDLTLFSDLRSTPQLACPPEMEAWLKASPKGEYKDEASGEKVMPKVEDFFGLGRSDVDYHLHGRMHGLPPQEGIPGFQRVSMLKYLPCVNGMYGTGRTSFWAYEGCVLPGNQIMLGRWWCPTGVMDRGYTYCGPFIFWRVSGSAEDRMRTTGDALNFLERVEEKTVG